MSTFTYTSPAPPGQSIAELLLRQGDIQANVARGTAEPWAGAIRSIGQEVGRLPAQIQQQKIDALKTEALGQGVEEGRRLARSRNVFEAGFKVPENYNADGTVNDAAMSAWLKKNDVSAWQQYQQLSTAQAEHALTLRKTLGEIATNDQTLADKQRTAAEAKTRYMGNLAFNAVKAMDEGPGDPLHIRDTALAGVVTASKDGLINSEQGTQFLQQVARADPHQLRQIFLDAIPPDQRMELESKAATTAKTKADAAHLEAETKNLQMFGSATPAASQMKPMRVKGVGDVPVEYVPGKAGQGGSYFLVTPDGRKQLTPGVDFTEIPPASIAIHTEKESAAKGTRRELAEQLVNGNLPPSMLSRRAEDYNATLSDAGKIYEERTGKKLNFGKLQLDYEAAKKFVSGMNGPQMIRYRGLADSVVNTIGEVERLGDTLQQSGIQKWNSVKRSTIRQVYGNTPESELANQYVGAINTLKEEFANLANGGYAPTDAAWHLANDQINGDFGFKDLRASLTEVQRLINYRTQAFNDEKPYTIGGNGQTPPPATAPIKVGGFTVVVK